MLQPPVCDLLALSPHQHPVGRQSCACWKHGCSRESHTPLPKPCFDARRPRERPASRAVFAPLRGGAGGASEEHARSESAERRERRDPTQRGETSPDPRRFHPPQLVKRVKFRKLFMVGFFSVCLGPNNSTCCRLSRCVGKRPAGLELNERSAPNGLPDRLRPSALTVALSAVRGSARLKHRTSVGLPHSTPYKYHTTCVTRSTITPQMRPRRKLAAPAAPDKEIQPASPLTPRPPHTHRSGPSAAPCAGCNQSPHPPSESSPRLCV